MKTLNQERAELVAEAIRHARVLISAELGKHASLLSTRHYDEVSELLFDMEASRARLFK